MPRVGKRAQACATWRAERALPDAQRAVSYRGRPPRNTLGTILFALNQPTQAAQAFRSHRDRSGAAWARAICYVSLLTAMPRRHSRSVVRALVDPRLVVARNNLALVYALTAR
jgi:hypothetical protein